MRTEHERAGHTRRRGRWALGALLGALALGGVGPAAANDGAFHGNGATVFPVKDTAVTMAEEDLSIEQIGPPGSYIAGWQVKVRYRFENTSDQPVTVQMGFPEACERTPDDDADEEAGKKVKCRPTIFDFVAEVDGVRAPVTVKAPERTRKGPLADEHFDRVHTFEVKFAPRQSRVVQHRYRNGVSITSPMTSHLDYILRTAGLWKGPIGRLDITVTLKDRFGEIQQTPYDESAPRFPLPDEKLTEGSFTVWKWHLKDYSPKANLGWTFGDPATLAGSEALLQAKIALSEAPQNFEKLDAGALRRLRNLPYAVNGYVFKDADLAAYYAQQPWYVARPDFEPRWLSADDMKFVKKIKAMEAKQGKAPR